MKYIFLVAMLLTSLVSAEETKRVKQFMIKTTVSKGSEKLSTLAVTTQINNEAILRVVNERYLPQDWQIDMDTMLPKPSFDDPTDFGVILKVIVKESARDGQKLTLLSGELIIRDAEPTPKITSDKKRTSSKDSLFFQSEKKVLFAFDMTNRETVTYTFKDEGNEYKVVLKLNEHISKKEK